LAGNTPLLALGTSSTTALAGNTTTITSAQIIALTCIKSVTRPVITNHSNNDAHPEYYLAINQIIDCVQGL
jgi:hypothetical protein